MIGTDEISGIGTPVISASFAKNPENFSSTRCKRKSPKVTQYKILIFENGARVGSVIHRRKPLKYPIKKSSEGHGPNEIYPTVGTATVNRAAKRTAEVCFVIGSRISLFSDMQKNMSRQLIWRLQSSGQKDLSLMPNRIPYRILPVCRSSPLVLQQTRSLGF